MSSRDSWRTRAVYLPKPLLGHMSTPYHDVFIIELKEKANLLDKSSFNFSGHDHCG